MNKIDTVDDPDLPAASYEFGLSLQQLRPLLQPVGAGNSVTAVDLVSSAEPGKIKLGIWLRGSHALGHFQYSCYYDSPTS